jgi:hypothetical protein
MAYKNPEDHKRYLRERYKKVSEWIREYKLEKGCVDCGYNAHHAALEFDHLEPHIMGTVSSLAGSSLARVQKEIAVCEVVCRNCHGIRTFSRGKYGRPLKDQNAVVV